MEQPSLTLRDYLRVFFRNKSIFTICFLTVMTTVYLGLQLKTPVYQSQVKMHISAEKQLESPYYRELAGQRSSNAALTQSEIVKSNPVLERTVNALNLHNRPVDYEKAFCSPLKVYLIEYQTKKFEETTKIFTKEQKQSILFHKAIHNLKANIEIEPIRDTNLFMIKIKDYDRIGAAIIANVLSRSYIIFDLEQQLSELQIKYGDKHPSIQQLKDTIVNMSKNLSGQIIPNIEAIGPASVKIFEQAIPGLRPIGTSKKITIILAFFMSIFLGVMLVFVFDYMDQTFKSPQEVERLLNTPVLGSIPKMERKRKVVIKDTDKKTPYTYAYQILSDQIYMLMKDRKIKSLTLTSALAQEGVSTIIANVGTYLAKKAGHKVLIVDANLRTPKIHALFNIKNDIGLGQVLEGKAQSDKIIHNLGENLFVVSAGNTELNPVTLLDSSVMTDFLQKAQEIFDIVLIDCSELKDFKDAVLLSSRTDGTAFVINEGKTRKQVIQKVIGILDKDKMLGVILNKRTFSIPKVIYDNF